MRAPLPAAALALLALSLAMSAIAKPVQQAPEPPPLPTVDDALGYYRALSAEDRQLVDEKLVIVTFAEKRTSSPDRLELLAVSIGTMRHPPEAILSLLASVADYPGWVRLHPSYKKVRLQGATRMSADVGSADEPKAKRTMLYEIAPGQPITTWRVLDSGSPIEPDSSISFEVVAHPSLEGASLVVHRQYGILPDSGRMTKYLASDDDKGRNRWWKDSNRHARRIHWAMDAALVHPPGKERDGLYCEHYQREFKGQMPFWSTR